VAREGRTVLVIIGNLSRTGGCVRDCRRRGRWVKVASLRRKHVLLLDPPRPDVVSAFHAADLFVFGSNVEYSPLVLFEAMASRTPFLTVACGSAREIVAWGGGGVIVPTEERLGGMVGADPSVMARMIEDLILNPRERDRLGEAGHGAWQGRFTWERIAGEYERLYLKVMDSRERG